MTPKLQSSLRFQSGATEDYYSLLGVTPAATKDEIKSAYKKQALKYHPDRNREKGADEKFKKVSEAYSILSNQEKRQQYDAMRSYGRAGGGPGGGMGGMGGAGFPGNMNANYGQYGGGAQRTTRPAGGQQQAGQSTFYVNQMSQEEADRIFSSIFGTNINAPNMNRKPRMGNPMDDIFGGRGHPAGRASGFGGPGGNSGGLPQPPPGSVLQSKTTTRNPDGTFQREEIYKTPDGRQIKFTHVYERSGAPPEEGSQERFSQKSGGFRSFAEHVASNYQQQSQRQQQQQQYQQQGNQQGQQQGGQENVNFPHNPFRQANPQSQNPFAGGTTNPFASFSNFGQAFSNASGPFSNASNQQQQNPNQQQQQGSSSWNSWGNNGGTGSAFAGGNGNSYYRPPMFFYSGNTGLRMLAFYCLLGFILASLFSFTIQHPLFFIFLVTLFWLSRGRRFF